MDTESVAHCVCYNEGMPPEIPRQDATGPDLSRQDASDPEFNHSLTIEQVADRYAAAGHPRTHRTIQRYCAKGHLDARKMTTVFGDKYLVAPYSVTRHIAQTNEVIAFSGQTTGGDMPRQDAAGRDESRQDATSRGNEAEGSIPTSASSNVGASHDGAGKHGTGAVAGDRYVGALERENDFLRGQILIKDTQIGELSSRARETNVLIKGLQDLFMRLQPGRPEPRTHETISGEPENSATAAN